MKMTTIFLFYSLNFSITTCQIYYGCYYLITLPMDPVRKDKKKLKKIRIYLKTHRYLTPLNFQQERRIFFKDNKYNPQIRYPVIAQTKLKHLEEEIEKMPIPQARDFESYIYKRKLKETELKLRLLMAIGTSSVTSISTLLYQLKFDEKTLESAKKDASFKVNSRSNKPRKSFDITKAVTDYLENYQIKNWKIILGKRYDFSFQILPKSKLIKLGRNLTRVAANLEYSFAHEIDGHVVRAQNAQKQENKMYRNIFPFYIKTEEGLACYLGDYFSKNGEVERKNHALSFLAAYFAKTHTFSETYKYLTGQGMTSDLAFQKTFRLKRGLTNTEWPVVFAREAIYYEGMLEVKNYLDKGGDIRKLYAGKVGLDMLNFLPIPKNQILPNRLLASLN